MDPLDFEEWRRQQAAKLAETAMSPTDPAIGLPEAFAADRAERKKAGGQAYLASLVGGLLNQRPSPTPGAEDSAVKEWVMTRQARQGPKPASVDPLLDLKREKLGLEIENARKGKEKDQPEAFEPELVFRAERLGIPYEGRKREAVISDIMSRENAREARGAAAGVRDAEGEARIKAETLKATNDLRDKFQSLPVFKATQEMSQAIKGVRTATPDGVGDLSLIYSYVKILDPGSVVREGEIKLSREPTPLLSELLIRYKKIKEGDLLDDKLRAAYKREAELRWQAQAGEYRDAAKAYEGLATDLGVNPRHVILDYGFDRKPGGAVRKTLNGKTYEKRNGKWFEVD